MGLQPSQAFNYWPSWTHILFHINTLLPISPTVNKVMVEINTQLWLIQRRPTARSNLQSQNGSNCICQLSHGKPAVKPTVVENPGRWWTAPVNGFNYITCVGGWQHSHDLTLTKPKEKKICKYQCKFQHVIKIYFLLLFGAWLENTLQKIPPKS